MSGRKELRRRFTLTKDNALGVIRALAVTGDTTLQARDAKNLLRHFTPEPRIGLKFVMILAELGRERNIGWHYPLEEKATGIIATHLWEELKRDLNEMWDELKLPSLASEPDQHNIRLYYLFGRLTASWALEIPVRADEAPLAWVHIDEVSKPDTEAGLREYGRFLPELGSSEADLMLSFLGEKTGLTFEELAELFGLDAPCEWLDLDKNERPRNVLAGLLTGWVEAGEIDQVGPPNDPTYKLRQGPPLGNALDLYLDVWPWRHAGHAKAAGASEAAERAHCSKTNASDHLRRLSDLGLVKKQGNPKSNAPYLPQGLHPVPHLARIVARLTQERLRLPAEKQKPLTLATLEARLDKIELAGVFSKLRDDHRRSVLHMAVAEGFVRVEGERRRRTYAPEAEVELTPRGWLAIQGCPECAGPLHEGDDVVAVATLATKELERDGWTIIRHADCARVKDRSWSTAAEPLTEYELRVRTGTLACASCRGPLWRVTVADELEGRGESGGGVGVALAALARLKKILRHAPTQGAAPPDIDAVLRVLETPHLTPQHRTAQFARFLAWATSVDLGPRPNQDAWLDAIAKLEQRYHHAETGMFHKYAFWEEMDDAREQLARLVWYATRGKESAPARAALGKILLHHAVCPDAVPRDSD